MRLTTAKQEYRRKRSPVRAHTIQSEQFENTGRLPELSKHRGLGQNKIMLYENKGQGGMAIKVKNRVYNIQGEEV